MVHSCLQNINEKLDHESPYGFRPGRGCRDRVFIVKLAMKKWREHYGET